MTAAHDMLLPWEPTAAEPFDLVRAGHLFRRTTYGADLESRRRAVRRGHERTLDEILADAAPDAAARPADSGRWGDVPVALDEIGALRQVRVWRMLRGGRGLLEKTSQFWHDHFATSYAKVRDVGAMARHLALFDELGRSRFEDLLLAVARDPAMLRWLDNDTNVQGMPNENFARELLELFTMGRGSGYTETDVREAARAFTGWTVRDRSFRFDRRRHDSGEKTVLGVHGPLTGVDVVHIAAQRPETARHLARKLLAYFVHPEPTRPEVSVVADRFRDLDGDIGALLDVLLRSRLFFSQRALRSRIKDPLDWTVGTVRVLGVRGRPEQLAEAAKTLGLAIGEPPSVEGWPRESDWLTSGNWLRRNNLARQFVWPSAAMIERAADADELTDWTLDALLDGVVEDEVRTRVRERVSARSRPDRPRAAVQAVLFLPESHLL